MKNKQKKLSLSSTVFKTASAVLVLVVLFLLTITPVLAQGQLETGLQYGEGLGLGTQDIRITVMNVVRIFLGFIGIIAILLALYAGWLWMSSAGQADKIDQAKRILTNAVIGLVIIFSAFAIVSFIIGLLESATIGNGSGGSGGAPGACDNCGYLGTGIIERVYPEPFSRDNARNTNIMVTFKVPMNPATIIAGSLPPNCSPITPCVGTMQDNAVSIFPTSDDTAKLVATTVAVRTTDYKTFVFDPSAYLGNTNNNVWYSVKLTSSIKKDNGESAFPGVASYFTWRFEIGTFLDLDPVEASNVFPQPDSASDSYATAAPVQAQGSITVSALPDINQAASTGAVNASATAPAANLSGSYNCVTDALICVNAIDTTSFSIHPKIRNGTCSGSPDITVSGLNTAVSYNGPGINLGCGLSMTFANPTAAGQQWSFVATSQKTADTLRVGNTVYTFVASGTGGNQINIGSDRPTTAQNIVTALANNPAVDAVRSGNTVNLRATLAGSAGNGIGITASSNWATITAMTGGADAVLTPTKIGVSDQPRNAIIVLNFNESIDPTKVDSTTIVIEYFDGTDWQNIGQDGNYFISNQFKTVEFIPDSKCVDVFGKPIANSCGEALYCLPVINPDPNPYEATPYRVTVKAGVLKTCTTSADCTDPNFTVCPTVGAKVCTGTFGATKAFYPESTAVSGLVDAANNTFNGNSNNYLFNTQLYGDAEGPQSQSGQGPYDLNSGNAATQGDDLIWQFYVNKNIDLTPPKLQDIGPDINASGVNVVNPVDGTFDTLLMSNSLKPGSGYRDGMCGGCASGQCAAGQTCDPLTKNCVNDSGPQVYCASTTECSPGLVCKTKKYVTLIDLSVHKVAWWITNDGLDTVLPKDGFADQTKAFINHTSFSVVTSYGAEFASGVKDVYQNCFIPSEGPGRSSPMCGTSATEPYCCSGVASATACPNSP